MKVHLNKRGLDPRLLFDCFKCLFVNLLRIVARDWKFSVRDRRIPPIVPFAVIDKITPFSRKQSFQFRCFHKVKELLFNTKVAISLLLYKCFCNFFWYFLYNYEIKTESKRPPQTHMIWRISYEGAFPSSLFPVLNPICLAGDSSWDCAALIRSISSSGASVRASISTAVSREITPAW